ncbi:MAG TPA: PEGA domain-containing protein [Polyangiaceae bacterium]|nr:PEGA domain-containing protein [Polyangiaceae bacterium]
MPRMLSSHFLIAALALGTSTFVSAHALGQTSASETARVTELFKSGKVAFSKGDMAEAERLFAEALALRKSSDIAANLAQSELEQQKYRKAAEHFSWALANLLPSATDAQRKAVESGLARARTEVAVLRLEIQPEGSDVLVGQDSVGKSPVTSSVFVDAGEVIVSVKHDGFVSVDKRLMVGKGTEQAVEITLTPKDPAATPVGGGAVVDSGLQHPTEPGPSDAGAETKPKSLVPAFVATGVAVAGGVVGLVFTLSANSKEDEADQKRDLLNVLGGCNGGAPAADCADLKDQRDSVDSSRNLAVGAFVVGGVAALAAGYFYWDALRHRGSGSALQPKRTFVGGLTPSLDVGRARDAASLESVSLRLSGTF